MRVLAFLIVLTCSYAENAPVDGAPTCKCLGKLSSKIPTFDCDYAFAPSKKCVKVDEGYGDVAWWRDYPADYGSQCQPWPEPAWTQCYNGSAAQVPKVPEALLTPIKAWCTDPWCYVDPCQCDAPDVAASSTFHSYGEMKYSYAACGGVDLFTAALAQDKLGSGGCDVALSGAEVPWPRTSWMLALVGALASCIVSM